VATPRSTRRSALDGEGDGEWQDWLVDDRTRQETVLVRNEESDMRNAYLKDALTKLTDRERRVIEARKLQDDPATLDDLSQEFGVSRERIRQIEVRAFEKLQKAVKNAPLCFNPLFTSSEQEIIRVQLRGQNAIQRD
jgi:RNA polymerase sigma-32 factor